MSKTAKQPKTNKVSEKAGLTFNVNAIKRAIKMYYKSQNVDFSKISGGSIAMTSMLESMARLIIEKTEKEVAFNKSGLREVTREGMNSALLRNSNEYGYFVIKASDFNDKFDYSKFLPIEKEMDKIYTEYKNVSYSLEAKNYMYYLLYTMFTNISLTCAKLLSFAKNKMVNGNCVVHAVDIEFPKSISVVLMKNIHEALKLHGQTLEGKPEDDSTEDKTETGDTETTTEVVAEEPKQKNTKPKAQDKPQEKEKEKEKKQPAKPVNNSSPKAATTSTQTATNKKKETKETKATQLTIEPDDADDQDPVEETKAEAKEDKKPSKKPSEKASNQKKPNNK
jgi:hypothetical protein